MDTTVDKRALKILFDTYWSPRGWKDYNQNPSPEEFAYAKSAGVMFDPAPANHDHLINRLHRALSLFPVEQFANAFLASLSTHRLDLRSSLGSFAVFRHLHNHEPIPLETRCAVCGFYLGTDQMEDLNVLNFERFKWGGVRHDSLLYATFDLELFSRIEHVIPIEEDVTIFKNLIRKIEMVPGDTTAAVLPNHLTGILKSNKQERDIIVAILGFCGILETKAHQGYRSKFVPVDARDLPNRNFVDMAYPACWWSRSDGINGEALHEWFGHVL